jgi:probable F420-dependent oxidoreductase
VDPAPVLDDLSAFLITGRVRTEAPEDPRVGRSVRQGVDDGVEAERLGLRRVFLAERYNLKEPGAFLGGVAARTSRLEVGTGVIGPRMRHPIMAASLGATMHAAYGPRFILGLGRSSPEYWFDGKRSRGEVTYREIVDYAGIIKRLWAGETVNYEGPAGDYENLRLGDCYEGPAPQIWFGILAGPKASRVAASPVFDGVLFPPMFTPDAIHASVKMIREECDRIGRDPATLRICHSIVTAPDLDDFETRALAHARAVTYFQWPVFGKVYSERNGWDLDIIEKLQNHSQFLKDPGVIADLTYHRAELMDPAALVPNSWMHEVCAIGSVADCVKTLRSYRDTGVDELAIYGSTPAQNARLIDAWRAETAV